MTTVPVTHLAKKDTLSLPLYFSGLIVTLCGVLTVAYTVEDAGFTTETLLLTLVGFVFSLGCRALRINSRVVEWLGLGLIVFAVYGVLSQRIDWNALIPSGADRNDTKLAVLLCWAAVLRSWVLFSDDAVLSTPLLVFAAIGLVSSFDLNTPVVVYFCVGMVATTFLLIHYHALRQRAMASPSERAREIPGLVLAQLGLAVLCGLAVVGMGGVLIVPLEAVSKNLSLAGTIRQLASLGAPAGAGGIVFHFSDDSTLMVGTGDGWSASPQVLLRVTPDDGQPHLWRGRTYDQYIGASWVSTQGNQAAPVGSPMSGGDGSQTFTVPASEYRDRPMLTAGCDVVGETEEFYYAAEPRRLTLTRSYGDDPRIYTDGRLDLSGHLLTGAHYTVMSLLAPDPMDPAVQERLRRTGTEYPIDIRSLYLGAQDRSFYRDSKGREQGGLAPPVAAFLRASVAQALHRLPKARRTPIDEALAIRDWVANRCVYSLAAPAIPRHTDRVYEFLAHTRTGYCDLFASSMTLLCRSAGIPARLATGFAPGEQDGQTYNLRALDKHAWTEVYFPGEGWLAFDPTMGTRTDGTVPTSTPRRHWDWQAFVLRLGNGPLALSAVIVALLLYVAKTEVYDRWRGRRPGVTSGSRAVPQAHSGIGRRYARMLHLMRGLGLPHGPAETPGEYAARARAFLLRQKVGAPDPATVEALTAQFVAARYGAAEEPSDAQTQSAEQALREFASAARRLRWAHAWDTLRRRVGARRAVPLR